MDRGFVSSRLSSLRRRDLELTMDFFFGSSQIGASEWILKGGEPSERDVPVVEKIVESESTSVEEIHAESGKEGVVVRDALPEAVALALQELKV